MPLDHDHHMGHEQFRELGHQLIDWIADYRAGIEDRPVLASVEPGWVRSQLPVSPPDHGEDWGSILADLDDVIVPGLSHWQHPGWHAFFPANASYPSVLGELLSAGLGVQGMLWATSPACTEVETHLMDWLVELCGLPERFLSTGQGGGVIQDSASSAAIVALVAARDRVADGREVAYISSEAHSSLEKGARIARYPELRVIPVGDDLAMDLDALRAAIAADRAAGLTPTFVNATIGTTGTNAVDPVAEIADVARAEDLWLHVDAAMAGAAFVCPEFRDLADGLDRADSYCFNAHKWLFTNFDCTAFYVADRGPLIDALSIVPEYLRNASSDAGSVIDYRDWQLPLGRRFRALKLWFVLRHYGATGLRHHVRRHVELTADLEGRLASDERFEVVAPRPLNLVCFRCTAGEADTEALLAAINAGGSSYCSHTKIADRTVIRVCIGQSMTEQRHVDALWRAIDRGTAPQRA